MNIENNRGGAREVQEKIVNLMKSIAQAPRKPLPGEEVQRLKTAASRLDQLLKASAAANQETLRTAAGRLDQLLHDIRNGNDIISRIKRQRPPHSR